MSIDTIIANRHLLTHPFYERWQKGKVPIQVLQSYSKQYYHYESALPEFLESALNHLEEGPAKQAVSQVLEEERSHPKAHTELWMDFAHGLGLSDDQVLTAPATPQTTNLVQTYRSLCSRGSEEALGALYAYEAQVSEVAKTKGAGLREFYGVDNKAALNFFDLHSTMDVEHAKAIRKGFTESEFALESAHLALDAWWTMLDQFEHQAAAASSSIKA